MAPSQRGTDTPVVVLCNVRHASGCSVQGEAVQCTVATPLLRRYAPGCSVHGGGGAMLDTPLVVVCTGEAVQCSVIRNLGPGDLFQSASVWHKHSHQPPIYLYHR